MNGIKLILPILLMLLAPQALANVPNALLWSANIGENQGAGYTFTVDPGVTELAVIATSIGLPPTVRFTSPTHQVYNTNNSSVKSVFLHKIKNPRPGLWTVSVAANAPVTLQVRANSSIYLLQHIISRQIEKNGGLMLVKYNGRVQKGADETVAIQVLDTNLQLEKLQVLVVNFSGQVLATIQPFENDEINGIHYLYAHVTIPDEPFRIMIAGKAYGRLFQRMAYRPFEINL
jgi:hypothetical protein